jgi:hypothetical protein
VNREVTRGDFAPTGKAHRKLWDELENSIYQNDVRVINLSVESDDLIGVVMKQNKAR